MIINLINNSDFQRMMESHLKDMMIFLLERDTPFAILCNLEHVEFDPPLPSDIYDQLQSVTLFMIAGYTFESFEVHEHHISFEAGFGPQNFGSVVSMPLLGVLQVIVEDTPLLVNMALVPKIEEKREVPGVKSSLEALLNNPENRRFLKGGTKDPSKKEES